MLGLVSKIRATWQTAKLCHWMCVGEDFAGDHELYDRVFKDLHGEADDLVDSLVEIYFMGEKREDINLLNNIAQKTADLMPTINKNVDMPVILKYMLEDLNDTSNSLKKKASGSVTPILDEITTISGTLIGLLSGRADTTKYEGARSSIRNLIESVVLKEDVEFTKVGEDIPNESSFDNPITYYGFEHHVQNKFNKSASFKWYEHAYGDKSDGLSPRIQSFIRNKLVKVDGTSFHYERGQDWFNVCQYTLDDSSFPRADAFKIILVSCGGGSRDTSWNNEFIVFKDDKDIKILEDLINQEK